jgi:tRNA threonylcarbamoyladenosine biosynthesis protein TsaE
MPVKTISYETHSEKETYELGKRLAKEIKAGDSISLEGDLGTGKTALTKGIAKGLGIKDHIVSPTFTIVNTYEGRITLHHFDVYRIDDPGELYAIGWDEYFSNDAVTIVEWGDRVRELLPDGTLRIMFSRSYDNPDYRLITLERQEN